MTDLHGTCADEFAGVRDAFAANFDHGDLGASCAVIHRGDLVVDLSGITELDLASLALLLTAQQNVEQEDRDVWLAGVPLHVWQALNAMGLGRFFKPFPVSGEVAV